MSSSNDRPSAPAFSVDPQWGASVLHPVFHPLLLVLSRHHFGLGYWVFIAVLLVLVSRRRSVAADDRTAAHELQGLALYAGVVWFLFAAAVCFALPCSGGTTLPRRGSWQLARRRSCVCIRPH